MATKNRDELKAYFEVGNSPTQENFADLIDSFINKEDANIKVEGEKIGIGLSCSDTPLEKLEINGAIRIRGNAASGKAGTIQWVPSTDGNGGDLQVHNGSGWKSLTKGGGWESDENISSTTNSVIVDGTLQLIGNTTTDGSVGTLRWHEGDLKLKMTAGNTEDDWTSLTKTNIFTKIKVHENEKIGIGLEDNDIPETKVHIKGPVKIDGSEEKVLYINDSSNNEILTINQHGNVGIGTNNPQEALEVNGTVKADRIVLNGIEIVLNGSEITTSSVASSRVLEVEDRLYYKDMINKGDIESNTPRVLEEVNITNFAPSFGDKVPYTFTKTTRVFVVASLPFLTGNCRAKMALCYNTSGGSEIILDETVVTVTNPTLSTGINSQVKLSGYTNITEESTAQFYIKIMEKTTGAIRLNSNSLAEFNCYGTIQLIEI